MSAVMPQAVADRIMAFMVMEKTGRIELNFKRGRLLGLEVIESIRVGSDGPEGETERRSDGSEDHGTQYPVPRLRSRP